MNALKLSLAKIEYPLAVRLALNKSNGHKLTESEIEALKTDYPWFDIDGYTVISMGVSEDNTSHDIVVLKSDSFFKPHIHDKAAGLFIMLSGRGSLLLNNTKLQYQGGEKFAVPPGAPHGFKTQDQTIFLSLNNPPITDPHTKVSDFRYPQD